MVYYANCCCCNSKIGAKIIAIFGMAISTLVFFTIVTGYGLLYGELHGYRTNNIFRSRKHLGIWGEEIALVLGTYIDTVFGIIFVICLVWFATCLLLFNGINMKHRNFILPWLILHMIGLIVSRITAIK